MEYSQQGKEFIWSLNEYRVGIFINMVYVNSNLMKIWYLNDKGNYHILEPKIKVHSRTHKTYCTIEDYLIKCDGTLKFTKTIGKYNNKAECLNTLFQKLGNEQLNYYSAEVYKQKTLQNS